MGYILQAGRKRRSRNHEFNETTAEERERHAGKKEISNNAHGPYIHGLSVTSCVNHTIRDLCGVLRRTTPTLLKYLWSHVLQPTNPSGQSCKQERQTMTDPRRSADLRQLVQLFRLHYPAETKVGNHDVGVFCGRAEKEILGFEIFFTN